MKHIVLVLAAAGVAAACAATAEDPAGAQAREGRDCFNVRSVNGYSEVDRDTVRLNVSPTAVYEVDTWGARCAHLDWSSQIAVKSDFGSFICVGDKPGQGELVSDRGDVCRIGEVRRVDLEAEKAAKESEAAEGDDAES